VVALFRRVGLIDDVAVLGQIGIPVVGFGADKAVVAVETLRERPELSAGAL